jgi:hypothetical protein
VAIADEAQIDEMSAADVQQALEQLPDLRERLLRAGDLRGLKRLKRRKADLEDRLGEIRAANLKQRVDQLEAEYQETTAKANEAQRQAVVDAEAALAEREDHAERARKAHDRYITALNNQDHQRFIKEQIRDRLAEAKAELSRAMQALAGE